MSHKALPQWHWDSHTDAAFAEDVAFLREGGASIEHIAKRLGMTVEALEKRLKRARERGLCGPVREV